MFVNKQKPEPQVRGDSGTLVEIQEYFLTIQGEGPFVGRRAMFIRLAGCNLRCPGCDTDYTSLREFWDTPTLVERVTKHSNNHNVMPNDRLAVITGGEPFRQPIGLLVFHLLQQNFIVQIESNGVLKPDSFFLTLMRNDPERVFVVVSPKTSLINEEVEKLATVFKYVVKADEISPLDGLPRRCLDHPANVKGVARPPVGFPRHKIYLSPYDEQDPQKNADNLKAVRDLAIAHGYVAGIQLHKLMDIA